jgi:hypothetical protein
LTDFRPLHLDIFYYEAGLHEKYKDGFKEKSFEFLDDWWNNLKRDDGSYVTEKDLGFSEENSFADDYLTLNYQNMNIQISKIWSKLLCTEYNDNSKVLVYKPMESRAPDACRRKYNSKNDLPVHKLEFVNRRLPTSRITTYDFELTINKDDHKDTLNVSFDLNDDDIFMKDLKALSDKYDWSNWYVHIEKTTYNNLFLITLEKITEHNERALNSGYDSLIYSVEVKLDKKTKILINDNFIFYAKLTKQFKKVISNKIVMYKTFLYREEVGKLALMEHSGGFGVLFDQAFEYKEAYETFRSDYLKKHDEIKFYKGDKVMIEGKNKGTIVSDKPILNKNKNGFDYMVRLDGHDSENFVHEDLLQLLVDDINYEENEDQKQYGFYTHDFTDVNRYAGYTNEPQRIYDEKTFKHPRKQFDEMYENRKTEMYKLSYWKQKFVPIERKQIQKEIKNPEISEKKKKN